MTCKLQRQLNAAERALARQEEALVKEAWRKYVVPFCERRQLAFLSGVGMWAFSDADGRHVYVSSVWHLYTHGMPKRVLAVVSAMLCSGQGAGSIMPNYTPKKMRKT